MHLRSQHQQSWRRRGRSLRYGRGHHRVCQPRVRPGYPNVSMTTRLHEVLEPKPFIQRGGGPWQIAGQVNDRNDDRGREQGNLGRHDQRRERDRAGDHPRRRRGEAREEVSSGAPAASIGVSCIETRFFTPGNGPALKCRARAAAVDRKAPWASSFLDLALHLAAALLLFLSFTLPVPLNVLEPLGGFHGTS
jgi:hypothetical protein